MVDISEASPAFSCLSNVEKSLVDGKFGNCLEEDPNPKKSNEPPEYVLKFLKVDIALYPKPTCKLWKFFSFGSDVLMLITPPANSPDRLSM